ncbi:hypothetical protein BV898_12379 [Hypsibius exemplaris]|uniref:Protein sleepless n=1 Tax=Hypsibius exemplaris TaxID=2072580 RepID=A0A1W0WDY4_HYPEX|nr:hypothetical protein BV898_12379 [Hypsibius exemplaris]
MIHNSTIRASSATISVIILAILSGAYSLQCYSCKPEFALNCHYPDEWNVVQCGPFQDTCWKFKGNTTSTSGVKYVDQETRMCATVADLRRWSPGSVFADTCNNVRNIRSTDGQLFSGRICLCDDYNLCNGSPTRRQVSVATFTGTVVLVFLSKLSL